jgi:hypothetical protein
MPPVIIPPSLCSFFHETALPCFPEIKNQPTPEESLPVVPVMPVFFDFSCRQASTVHPEDGSFWRKQAGGEDS